MTQLDKAVLVGVFGGILMLRAHPWRGGSDGAGVNYGALEVCMTSRKLMDPDCVRLYVAWHEDVAVCHRLTLLSRFSCYSGFEPLDPAECTQMTRSTKAECIVQAGLNRARIDRCAGQGACVADAAIALRRWSVCADLDGDPRQRCDAAQAQAESRWEAAHLR